MPPTTSGLVAVVCLLVLPALSAADIEPYHATLLEPNHSTAQPTAEVPSDQAKPNEPVPAAQAQPAPQSAATTSATPQPPPAGAATNKSGNPVEPLSNGLKLSMTQAEIVAKFGDPTEHTFDARTFGYASFGVQCGGREAKIWYVTLKPGVWLSSGIGVGSTRADVARVFGSSSMVTVGQYKLSFRYNGGRVDQIGIAPASGDFVPTDAAAQPVTPTGHKDGSAATRSLVGTWYGAGDTKGQIQLKPDGTYDWSGRPAGRYAMSGSTVKFTGSLEPWNHGVATVNSRGDAIEFYWTTPAGAKQYFVFIR